MNFRTTAILLGIVIAAVAGLLIYSQLEEAPSTDGGLLGSFATGLKPSDVDTLELARTEPAAEKLVFVRTGGDRWELRQLQSVRVESPIVEAAVKALWDAKPVKHPGTANTGIDKPTITATLKSKGERSVTVSLGETTLGGSEAVTFVSTADRPTVPLAVRTSDLRALFRDGQAGRDGSAATKAKWLGDYRSKRLLSVDSANPGGDIALFQLTRGKEILRLAHAADGSWTFEQPANFGEADTLGDPNPKTEFFTGVRPLLNLLVNLQASSPDDFLDNAPESDWAKYGLLANDPAAVRVEVKPKGNAPAEVVFLGQPVEGAAPTRIYCRREGEPGIVKVPFDRLATIAGTLEHPGELRNRDFLAVNRKELIDAFDITVKGEAFRLRKTGGGPAAAWKVYGGSEPRDGNPGAVQALIDALTKPRAAGAILDAPNPAAFAPADIQGEVKVWFGGVPKAAPGETGEPKPKGEADAAFTIGKVDAEGSFFKRTVNGAATEYRIGADLVAALTKRRLDYIAVKIEAFTPFGANALTLTRGANTVEVKKTSIAADPDMRWAFVQPAESKDKPADARTISQLLQSLGTVQPRRIVSDSPTPEQLKLWGLEPAVAVATVGLSGGDKPRGFLIGKETEDKANVYLKLAELPFVVLAPKVLLDELLAADFRDRVIFRTNPAKVVRIVLNGWKTPTTPARRVVLERKGGTWVSDVPDFAPDDAKVKAFLDQLRAPIRIDLVNEVKPAEQGLGADNGSLQVFLDQEGVAEPVWIDFGKVQPGQPALFATSSGVKDQVFTIDGTFFKQFTTDIKALQK
jgi:hypothetical protein